MLNWSFTMVKQIVVTIFVATNYWANSFFPLASTEASLLSLGATRQRQEAGDPGRLIFGSEVWDGRRLVATSGRWGRWCGSDHPPVRLYVGSTQGFCHGSRTCPGCWISHCDVCRSAVSIECWCLLHTYVHDAAWYQIQIDHIFKYIYIIHISYTFTRYAHNTHVEFA